MIRYGPLATAVLAALLMGSCTSNPAAGTAAPSTSTATSTESRPAPSNAAMPTTPPTPTTPAKTGGAVATVRCEVRNGLAVSAGAEDAGLGHRSFTLVFINRGRAACRLHGYPGVAGLDASGRQTSQAKRTLSGYLGGVRGAAPTVTIAPGESASALVEGQGFDKNGNACPGYRGLLVTAPDDTRSTRLSWTTDTCDTLQVHPVVPGVTGRG